MSSSREETRSVDEIPSRCGNQLVAYRPPRIMSSNLMGFIKP